MPPLWFLGESDGMTAIRSSSSSVVGAGGATLAGLAAGGLTAYLQGVVPAGWSTIANSGAVWTVVAFAVAAIAGRTRGTAIAAGLLALLGEVAGYYLYLAQVLHIPATDSEQVLWTMAAMWIGPLAGLGAFLARWGSARERMSTLLVLAGVLAGEGAYLIRLAGLPKPGWVEIVLALLLAAVAGTPGRVAVWTRAGAVALGAVTAAAVYFAYSSRLFG
jgi:Family of unknown function (DUF6518)